MNPSIALANEIRLARSSKLRQIREGEIDPVGAILTSREGMTAMDLLRAIPRFGKHKAAVTLENLGLREDLVFGEPTQGQINKGYRAATRRERVKLADEIESYMQRTGRRAA